MNLVNVHLYQDMEPFNKYFESTSAKSQNLIPNLSGLFVVNLHLAFVEKSCSSTVTFSPGLWVITKNGVFNKRSPHF